jgi:hypothetical protein
MRSHRLVFLASLLITVAVAASTPRVATTLARVELPEKLTDQEFWQLSADLSEPNGQFQSDNLLSNEMVFPRIVPDLISRTKPGGVYLGVGPEQNFTYIAAMKPRMVFITDIRRGNLELQLMYKALFEMSADRAEFVSRLFTKPRPAGLTAESTARDLMNAYWDVPTSDDATYNANLQAIFNYLTKTHTLPLSADDKDGLAAVYKAFYWYGPSMNYSASVALGSTPNNRGVTYADLMSQTDTAGVGLSYLASEEKFRFLKDLERRNMLVPVVGNFSGPKALRAVGAYLKDKGATVSAFYLSNVEMYLRRAGTWSDFCANVATMPLDDDSVFIRPSGAGGAIVFRGSPVVGGSITTFSTSGGPSGSGLIPMIAETRNCAGGLR